VHTYPLTDGIIIASGFVYALLFLLACTFDQVVKLGHGVNFLLLVVCPKNDEQWC
jgi:hypothetical protein